MTSRSCGAPAGAFFDDVTVSRMTAPKPRHTKGRIAMARKKGTDVMFAPQPIELTLRKRQALQPSNSAPNFRSTFSLEPDPVMLPRISVSRAGPSWESPGNADAEFRLTGFSSASTSTVRSGQERATQQEAWLSVLNGNRRVEIPFTQFGEESNDADAFAHWYRKAQVEAQHRDATTRAVDEFAGTAESFRSLEEPSLLVWERGRKENLAMLRRAERGSGSALRFQSRLDLFTYLDTLEDGCPRQGGQALMEALSFKLGSCSDAQRMLNVNGNGELSLMEFAGSVSLLDLDFEILAGMEEGAYFERLDENRSGFILLRDIFGLDGPPGWPSARKDATMLPGDATQVGNNRGVDIEHVMSKWVVVARWMATAGRRSTALKHQRFNRGWRVNGAGSSSQKSQTSSKCRCKAVPEVVLLETAATMREQEKRLHALFSTACSVKSEEDGSKQLMHRADLHLFFSDLRYADPRCHDGADPRLVNLHYDEAMQLQISATKIEHGLLFWSFKALLNNVVGDLGLGWMKLVEQTIDLSRME